MSISQESSNYIGKIQDGREVRFGEEKVDINLYLNLFGEWLNPISEFFDGLSDFNYSPFMTPETTLELEKQKYHLSYQFAESPFFSEGWTDIAHSFIQGWFINREYVGTHFPQFSESINLLVERLEQQKLLVTIPYVFGSSHSIRNSSLKVTSHTDKGIFIKGMQKLPIDSLAVHELLTIASHQENKTLFIMPLNSARLSLHIQEKNSVMARFDDVFIPWDRVLVQEEPENISQLFHPNFATTYPDYHRVASLLHQLEWLTGLVFYVAEETGENKKLHNQEVLGELLQQLDIIGAYLHLSEIKAEKILGGVIPNEHVLQTAKGQGIPFYKRALDILQRVGRELFLQQLYQSETNDEAEKLYTVVSEYGTSTTTMRRLQYQLFYLGDPEYVLSEYYKTYSTTFLKNRLQNFWDFHKSGNLLVAIPTI